jgi:hypothetical protein
MWAEDLTEWAHTDDRLYDRRFYFRPAHEMNGDWFPWSATDSESTPADYVTMWQRMYDIFSDAGLSPDHIQWMWSPNASGIPETGTETYYPGDDYVDWIGIDGFNFGDAESWSEWITPRDRFEEITRTIRRFSEKPIALSEVASSSFRDGKFRLEDKAEWIRNLFDFVEEETIKMVLWFNVDKQDEGDSDWAIFGGARGTDNFEYEEREYAAYSAYREAVSEANVLSAYSDYPRLLTDAEFAGQF